MATFLLRHTGEAAGHAAWNPIEPLPAPPPPPPAGKPAGGKISGVRLGVEVESAKCTQA